MEKQRRSLYLYPVTKYTFREGGNSYIPNLAAALGHNFDIINKQTSLGLLDVLLKIPKTDIIYFNWIEDISGKRFAYLQALVLFTVLIISRVFSIRIVWFIHNNLSHFNEKMWLKKLIVAAIAQNADVILSHSRELSLKVPPAKLYTFDHPIDRFNPLMVAPQPKYDLLIWGRIGTHKGVIEFIRYNYSSEELHGYKILIAGKFESQQLFTTIEKFLKPNISIDNRILPESELEHYLKQSRYVLFTYNAPSVLSSAALCKTLSYGKIIIGPERGSFKELGERGLIYTYKELEDLTPLLQRLDTIEAKVNTTELRQYIEETSWAKFTEFLLTVLNADMRRNTFFSIAPFTATSKTCSERRIHE